MNQAAHILEPGGAGADPPAGNASFLEAGRGVIRTDVVLDGNGRVAELIDDRGAGTAFAYDTLDRQVTLTFHDQSVRTNTFNATGDVVGYADENGSAFAFTYDAIGRRTAVAITPATGVGGATAQAFQYDGLSRMTSSLDTAAVDNYALFYYDSLGRVLEESQNSQNMTHQSWTSYPATGFTFEGGRQLTLGYEALYRKNTITETSGGTSIAAWQFFGSRIATVTLGNGIVCSFMNNMQSRSAIQAGLPTPPWGSATTDQLGFDGAGRVSTKRYLLPSGGGSPGPSTLVVGFTTAYDRSGNKLFERHLHAESRSHLYPAYDSPNRLLQYQRGILATGGASIATPITLPNTDSQRSYALDGLGNWNNTAYTQVGGSATTEYRRHNYLNQVTRYGATPVTYDHGNNAGNPDPNIAARGNGNIVNDGLRTYQYDALNRLIQVNRNSDSSVIANYYYDALGRRTIKTVSNGGIPNDPALNGSWTYLYDGARVVEEIQDYTTAQYVWGQYIDELVQLNAVTTLGPQSLPAGKYYLLSDLLYRSVALTNSAGVVVEAYDTDAYGNTLLFKAAGTGDPWFTDADVPAAYSACRYVFTGREYDAETGLCFYRRRYYNPYLGRFLGRDPAGYRAGTNLYGYVRANPVVKVDPSGLACFAPSSGAGGLGLGSAAGDTLAGGTLAAGETLTAGEALAGGLEIAGLVDAGSGVINPVGAVAAGVIVVGAIGLAAYLYFRDSSPAVPAPCPTVRIPRPPAILDPTIPALVLMCALLFEMKPSVFEGGRQPPPGHYDEDLFCIDCECKIQDTEVLLHLGPMLADECDAAPVVLGWMLIETCDCVPLLLG